MKRTFGFALILLGIFIALFSYGMDTSVSSAGTYIGGQFVGGGDTYNLGLLQAQMMMFETGVALFLAGSFFAASGERNGRAEPRAAAPIVAMQEETAQEREDRMRRTKVVGFGLLGFLLLLMAISYLGGDPLSAPDNTGNTMNVEQTMDAELDGIEEQANQDTMDAANTVDNALEEAVN